MANYKIVSHAGAGLPLNVATTTTISRRTNVNIWSDTGIMYNKLRKLENA